MHEGAAMRLIETRWPVRVLDYIPSGGFLVYTERQDSRTWRDGLAKIPVRVHCVDLSCGQDSWNEVLSGSPKVWLSLPAGRLAAYTGMDGTGRRVCSTTIYECAADGLEPVQSPTYKIDAAGCRDFSKDGRFLAWKRLDRENTRNEIIWQETANPASQGVFRPHGNMIQLVQFSNDSEYLATTERNHLTIWSMLNHESVAVLTGPASEPFGPVSSWIWCEFSPDASNIFVGTQHQCFIWDPGADKARFHVRGIPNALAYSRDGRYLALGIGSDVEIWDTVIGKCRRTYEWPKGKISCIAFAPDGLTIAAGGENGIVIWDLDDL
jgi:WD40 repeat protein